MSHGSRWDLCLGPCPQEAAGPHPAPGPPPEPGMQGSLTHRSVPKAAAHPARLPSRRRPPDAAPASSSGPRAALTSWKMGSGSRRGSGPGLAGSRHTASSSAHAIMAGPLPARPRGAVRCGAVPSRRGARTTVPQEQHAPACPHRAVPQPPGNFASAQGPPPRRSGWSRSVIGTSESRL